METKSRFLIVLGITVFALLCKWFTLNFIATEQVKIKCMKWFGFYPERPTFGCLFRSLGWDLANAALGLMVLACILENSNLRKIVHARGNYDLIFIITLFMLFVIVYNFALVLKYVFIESTEKVCFYRNGKFNMKRFWCSFVLWGTGLFMLVNSSWFIVGK